MAEISGRTGSHIDLAGGYYYSQPGRAAAAHSEAMTIISHRGRARVLFALFLLMPLNPRETVNVLVTLLKLTK